MRTLSAVGFLIGLICGVNAAQAQQDESAVLEVQRLAAVGRLYGVVKYFHPAFLIRDVPWDSAVAEQVAFFFAGANGTTLIGSPTAGGVGALTTVTLPGGIAATFPGSEALLADGRPMIRVGVPPDVLVRPTIAGIRAGRDEVLERALEYLGAGR